MTDRLQETAERYRQLEAMLSSPEVSSDPIKCAKISKEYKSLTPLMEVYTDLLAAKQGVSDALALSEKFEANLTQFSGNLLKAAVELAQGWRLNREGRSLEALMIAADKDELVLISGSGEVILPDEGVLAIGSGGNYALAAARALMENTELSAEEIARKALGIASSICVYTNDHIIVEVVS